MPPSVSKSEVSLLRMRGLINSTKPTHSWDPRNSQPAGVETLYILWESKDHDRVHKSQN